MYVVVLLWLCVGVCQGQDVVTEDVGDDDNNNTTSEILLHRNVTSHFENIRNISLLQIRSQFETDIDVRPGTDQAVTVDLGLEGTNEDALLLVNAIADFKPDGQGGNIMIIQIASFPDTPLWVYISSGVGAAIFVILVIIVGIVCWRKHRVKRPMAPRQVVGSKIRRMQQRFHSTFRRQKSNQSEETVEMTQLAVTSVDLTKSSDGVNAQTDLNSNKDKPTGSKPNSKHPKVKKDNKDVQSVSSNVSKTGKTLEPTGTKEKKNNLTFQENIERDLNVETREINIDENASAVPKGNIKGLLAKFQNNTENTRGAGDVDFTSNQKTKSTDKEGAKGVTKGGKRGGGRGGIIHHTLTIVTLLSVFTVLHAVATNLVVKRITIRIHPNLLNAKANIEIIVPRSHFVGVNYGAWSNNSSIPLNIYDVTELPSMGEFCQVDQTCGELNRDTRSHVTCDGHTMECVCRRGYIMQNGACVDLDECATDNHNCHLQAICDNTEGSYTCTCNHTLDIWGDGKSCQACSEGCPVEHYESAPCSNTQDRVCTECRQCGEDEYEFYGCGSKVNRHCLHPAGSPAVLNEDQNDDRYTPIKNASGYVIRHDDNMFGENLHNMTTMSWVYNLTMANSGDGLGTVINLVRASGIQLNMTLHRADIQPRFNEVPTTYHSSVYDITGLSDEHQDRLNSFKSEYCSKPVPDYYMLDLKVHKDRTTDIETVTCSPSTNCPDSYSHGEQYSYRTINTRCPDGTPFDTLRTPDGGTLCQNEISLMEIYGENLEQTPVLRFPTVACRNQKMECDSCLKGEPDSQCPAMYLAISNQTDRERCCKISCFTRHVCKRSSSPECRMIAGQCSKGDSAEFVLTSHLDEDSEYTSCLLRHTAPDILYSYSYSISWPQFDLSLDTTRVEVSSVDSDQGGTQGSHEYFRVRYDPVLDLSQSDIILRGRLVDNTTDYEFKTHAVKLTDFTGSSPKSSEIKDHGKEGWSRLVFQTSAPFAINKLIGAVTGPDHRCPDDVGDVYERQPLYQADGVDVEVRVRNIRTRTFHITPLNEEPNIRFDLLGNQSLMQNFLQESEARLINDDSLDAELDRERDEGIWEMTIKGYLSQCPGYIGFIVRDAHALLELIRYDALVQCDDPPCEPDEKCKFKVKFEIPMADFGDERLFSIKLMDFNSTYEILLASVNRFQLRLPSIKIPDYLFSIPEFPWRLFGSIIAIAASALISLLAMVIYAERTNPHRHLNRLKKVTGGKSGWVTGKDAELASKVYVHSNKLQARHCIFIIWTVIFKVTYACVFSFTAFYFILVMIHHNDLETIRALPKYIKLVNERNDNLSRAIDQHRENEILRQQNHTGHMQQSCDIYIQNLFKKMRKKMAELTLFHRLQMINITATISFQIGKLANKEIREFQEKVTRAARDYKQKAVRNLKNVFDPFSEWMNRVYNNGWFKIGRGFYNIRKHVIEPLFREISLPLPALGLLDFLGIDAVLDIDFLPNDLAEKIRKQLPGAPNFNIPDLEKLFPNFSIPGLLPDDLISGLVPDIPLDICPGLDDSDEPLQLPSDVDSQRSFVTALEQQGDSDDVLDEYFNDMEKKENTSAEARSLLRSYDNNTEFNIESADAEQEFYDLQQEVAAETVAVDKSQVWNYTKTSLYKMFGVLDIILITYRMTKMFIVIAQLIRGFPEVIPQKVTDAKIKENEEIAKEFEAKLHASQEKADAKIKASQEKSKAKMEKKMEKAEQTAAKETENKKANAEEKGTEETGNKVVGIGLCCFHILSTIYLGFIKGIKLMMVKAFRSPLIPKLLLGACVGIASYLVIVAGFLYMTVNALDELGVYDLLAAKLDLNVEYTNLKILDNLNFLQNNALKQYYNQMDQELSGMSNVITAFNAEQWNIVNNFENEICVYRKKITGSKNCDFGVNFKFLEMDLLPCSLHTTEPSVYRGYDREAFKNATKLDSKPYVDATRNVILKSFYAILIIIGMLFIIGALGYVLFRFLKSRNMIRIVKIYEMDKYPPEFAEVLREQQRRRQKKNKKIKLDPSDKEEGGGASDLSKITEVK